MTKIEKCDSMAMARTRASNKWADAGYPAEKPILLEVEDINKEVGERAIIEFIFHKKPFFNLEIRRTEIEFEECYFNEKRSTSFYKEPAGLTI